MHRLPPEAAPLHCGVRTFALSLHATWRCRSSLRCCTSSWPIPVEPAVRRRIERGAARGALGLDEAAAGALPAADWLVQRSRRRWLATADDGRCVFLEDRGSCGLQRGLGETAQPVSCREFPRLAVIEERGVSLSLTHYCPSAAALLFDALTPLTRVTDAAAFPPQRAYEGLDVRGVVAPWLRPGVWLDPEARDVFELQTLARLDRDTSPELALAALRAGVVAASRWRPADGPLAAHLERALGGAEAATADDLTPAAAVAALRAIDACAPRGLRDAPVDERTAAAWAAADAAGVAPAWASFARPLRAWLAARLMASWVLWQGDGLLATVRALELGLLALRALCARESARAGRALDRALLTAAIGEADLRLVQRADPRALARRASAPWSA
ncbi:MAG: hypothetical protein NDJ94_03760 [Vicinamibacteria bacterium]|jgi:hypothetical protein|nr:hypothetical protein [Vicinamibacteria bacterium]